MVVNNFHFKDIPLFPAKTNPPLLIDSDTVLAFTIPFQSFQAVGRGSFQIIKNAGPVEHPELSKCHPLDPLRQLEGRLSVEQTLNFLVFEGLDHGFIL